MRVIYTSKGMSKKFGDARYTLCARYLSKNTVFKSAPTCFGSQRIHHQGALYSAWLKLQKYFYRLNLLVSLFFFFFLLNLVAVCSLLCRLFKRSDGVSPLWLHRAIPDLVLAVHCNRLGPPLRRTAPFPYKHTKVSRQRASPERFLPEFLKNVLRGRYEH